MKIEFTYLKYTHYGLKEGEYVAVDPLFVCNGFSYYVKKIY